MEALTDSGRPVVFYDQLGCGNSARTGDPERWGVAPFLEELSAVRREIGLQHHLLGHSWGGMLAMKRALARAGGLASLVLIGAVVSGPMVFESRQRFYEKLPPDAREGGGSAGTRRRGRSTTWNTGRRWTSSTGAAPTGSTRGPTG